MGESEKEVWHVDEEPGLGQLCKGQEKGPRAHPPQVGRAGQHRSQLRDLDRERRIRSRKDKVLEIARAVEADLDHTLLVAGYAPEKIPVKDLLERLEHFKSEKVLDKELRASIRELFDLSSAQQKKVAEMLNAYVKTLRDQKKARAAARTTRAGRGASAQG